jgi:stage V sporulation protein B
MTSQAPPSIVVARGASYLFIQRLVSNVAGVIYFAFAARILSVAEVGVVSALGMVAALFVTFGTLALPSAATKYISEHLGKERRDMAKGVYKKVLWFGFLISGLLSFLCGMASTVISTVVFGSQAYQPLINVLALDVFALLLSPFFTGTLLGLQKFKEVAFAGIVLSCLRYSISLYMLIQGYGLMGLVIGWVIGDVAGLGFSFFFASTSFKTRAAQHPFMELVEYSLPLYASGVLTYFTAYIDRFIVLFFAGFTTLGIYSVAVMAASVVGLLSTSIGNSLFPQLSKLYGRHGRDALKVASMRASRYTFFILMPLAVGLAATSYPIITLFAGVRYECGWLPLAMISIAMALTCAGVVVTNLLLSLGSTRGFFEANTLGVAVGAVCSAFLVTPLGSSGAALGRVAMMTTSFGYLAYTLRRGFGLYFDLDAFKKSLVGSAVMAISIGLVQLVWLNRHMLPLYVLVGCFVYILMLRSLKAADNQDIILFHQFLPKYFGGIIDMFARFLGLETRLKSSQA